jgi:hypothetical protein
MFNKTRGAGGHIFVQRYIYSLCIGKPIDPLMKVTRTCGNIRCCNPDHVVLKHGGVPHGILTTGDVVKIRELRVNGMSYERIGKLFGVGAYTISKTLGEPKGGRSFRKLSTSSVLAIRRLRSEGVLLEEIAKTYDITISHVSRIGRGLTFPEVQDSETCEVRGIVPKKKPTELITRAEATNRLRERFQKQRSRLDEPFQPLLLDPVYDRLRNYEFEAQLHHIFGGEWVINEPCPFNGLKCAFGSLSVTEKDTKVERSGR